MSECSIAVPQQDGEAVGVRVRYCYIRLAIAVEVSHREVARALSRGDRVTRSRGKRAVTVAQKDVDTQKDVDIWCGGVRTGNSKVGDAVTIKVRRDHVPEDAPQGEGRAGRLHQR